VNEIHCIQISISTLTGFSWPLVNSNPTPPDFDQEPWETPWVISLILTPEEKHTALYIVCPCPSFTGANQPKNESSIKKCH
jgi:hypothetical protein